MYSYKLFQMEWQKNSFSISFETTYNKHYYEHYDRHRHFEKQSFRQLYVIFVRDNMVIF